MRHSDVSGPRRQPVAPSILRGDFRVGQTNPVARQSTIGVQRIHTSGSRNP